MRHCFEPEREGGADKPNDAAIRITDAPASENLEGERKTVTALFADIKGSTELQQDLDPEESRAIIDPALKIMIDAARHYDGYVQNTGDGIFALFGAPIAHEDHPRRALLAALRMQQEIRRYGDRLLQAGGVPIEIRVGVNTGEVVMRPLKTGDAHIEYAPIGHTTNFASRMRAVARTGSIVISEATRKLVEGYFHLKSIGLTKVKGVDEPVHVYEVTGLGPLRTRLQRAASRGYTKFVGREREMEALRRSAGLARQGHGQIAAAVAEAGVGKSRLIYEFKAMNQSDWMVLEALSVSHGKATAYLPLVELLHDYFGIGPDDEPRRRREKVAGKVTMLDRSLEETLPHLFALLGIVEGVDPLAGMDEQIRRRRTQDAVKRILLRESLNQPLMLIFEDLHWIDDATQGFLNILAEGVANAPVLMLVNYRSEHTHQWSSRSYYTQLRLDPLGKESAAEILSARIGDSPELVPLKRLVLERTEGNPLFIEELVEALFDEGVLVRNGAVKVARPISQLKIPPTVEGILAARIDRLPPEAKELLQTLAVIGSEFPLALVRQVAQLPDDSLDHLLNVLQAGEFIYEKPAVGDVQLTFKHALTRDEADKSLLTERRELLHERTARAIEELYCERLEDHYVNLAHHYRLSDNAAKAVVYLRIAGEQATDRGDYAQAQANLEPALRLIERLPDGTDKLRSELGVRMMEGRTATVLHGISSLERLRAFQRVCELSEQLEDDSNRLIGLVNVGFVYSNRMEAVRAREVARRCVDISESGCDHETLRYIRQLVGWCVYGSGELLQASSQLSDLMADLVSARSRPAAGLIVDPWANAGSMFAYTQLALGRPDEAIKLSEESLRRARQLNHPFMLALALRNAAVLRYHRREPEATSELAQATIALAEKYGFREHLATARSLLAWAMTELGQVDQGLSELEAGFTSATKKQVIFFRWRCCLSQPTCIPAVRSGLLR